MLFISRWIKVESFFLYQESEISQDLYTFHEAVSALQMLEEEVLDTHKMVMDQTTRFLNDAHSVFSVTHEVDYDQEGKTVKPYLPIHDSKTLLYSIPYVPPRYRILLAYFAHPRIIHACTYASTRNESVYIYIYTFLLFSRLVQTLHLVYIYIYTRLFRT